MAGLLAVWPYLKHQPCSWSQARCRDYTLLAATAPTREYWRGRAPTRYTSRARQSLASIKTAGSSKVPALPTKRPLIAVPTSQTVPLNNSASVRLLRLPLLPCAIQSSPLVSGRLVDSRQSHARGSSPIDMTCGFGLVVIVVQAIETDLRRSRVVGRVIRFQASQSDEESSIAMCN